LPRERGGESGHSFGNEFRSRNSKTNRLEGEFLPVDFAKNAESMGALTRKVESLADLGLALDWAKTTNRTTVITLVSDAFRWSPGDAWWDVGVPEVSERQEVRDARRAQVEKRKSQRIGV